MSLSRAVPPGYWRFSSRSATVGTRLSSRRALRAQIGRWTTHLTVLRLPEGHARRQQREQLVALFLGMDDLAQLLVGLLKHTLTLRAHLTDLLMLRAGFGQHVAHLCGFTAVPVEVLLSDALLGQLILDLARIRLAFPLRALHEKRLWSAHFSLQNAHCASQPAHRAIHTSSIGALLCYVSDMEEPGMEDWLEIVRQEVGVCQFWGPRLQVRTMRWSRGTGPSAPEDVENSIVQRFEDE